MKTVIFIVLVVVYLACGFVSQYLLTERSLKGTGFTYWTLIKETFKMMPPLGAIGVIVGDIIWAVFWPLNLIGSFLSMIAIQKHFGADAENNK